jgi:hypothetical protein
MATLEMSTTGHLGDLIPPAPNRGRDRTVPIMRPTDRTECNQSNKEIEPHFQQQVQAEAEKTAESHEGRPGIGPSVKSKP